MTQKRKWGVVLSGLFLCTAAAGNPLKNITIKTADGKTVAMQTTDLSAIKTRPLRKLKEKWDGNFKREFLYFKKIEVKAGQEIEGKCEVKEGPIRLSIYQISKKKGEPRLLRILSTRFHEEENVAEIKTKVEDLEENVFLITAEKVRSADQLNSHLKYMSSRDNEILISGLSTNWNLSELKLKMAKKEAAKNSTFVKDADWLIGQLIDPQWIVWIRVLVE